MARPTKEEIVREPSARKASSQWYARFVADCHPPIEQLNAWFYTDELEVGRCVDE